MRCARRTSTPHSSASRGPPSPTWRAATRSDPPRSPAALLAGEPGPRRDVVVLNAGAALEVSGTAPTLADGMAAAAAAIDSGAAEAALDRWIAVSNE